MLRSELEHPGSPWPCLRRDLEIGDVKQTEEGNVVLVRDPRSGELFEFSEEDHFLLSCLDGNLGPAGTIDRFAERFKQRVTPEQLRLFINMVTEWGLLEPGPGVPVQGEVIPFDSEIDPDSGIYAPQVSAVGQAAAGGGGQARRARLRQMARPGLISPDEKAEAAEYTERPEVAREQVETVAPRRGRGRAGAGLGRGGNPGGGGGGGGGGGWGGGGGMGGGRGMGGGGFGGGAGGGGFGGGGGGGGFGGGAGGGMGGGFGGGGGAGGGATTTDWEPQQRVEGDDKPFDREPTFPLFHPQRLFRWMSTWMWPLRWYAYLLPLVVGMGLWTVVTHSTEFFEDYDIYRRPMMLFEHLLFSVFTDNLLVQIGRGIICAGCGAQVMSFGIRLVFGLLPRFFTQLGSLAGLTRHQLLWVHGGPLCIRLSVFGLSAMAWYMTRENGTALHGIFLLLTAMGAFSFLFSLSPFMRGSSGYHLLTVLLNMPDLRQRSNRALLGTLRGRPTTNPDDAFALQMFALASTISVLGFMGLILTLIGLWLEANYQGLGVCVFILLLLILIWRFRKQAAGRAQQRSADRARKQQERIAELRGGGGPRALARLQGGAPGVPGEVAAPAQPQAEVPRKGNPFLRFGLLTLFIAVLFLPYHYEPGGPVTIMPMSQQDIHSEVSGVVASVNYNGGEDVKAGDVIALIGSLEEEREVQTTRAQIAKRQADLEELLSTPRPEDVAVAEQELQTAKTAAQFSKDEADRLEVVYKAGHISLEDYADARKKAEVDAQQVVQAQANLIKVKAGPHPKQIEALRYEIAGLQEQLNYYELQLTKAKLTMPFDGRISTINLHDLVGKWLDKGTLFAHVEDDSSVRVEFDIPEADVAEFAVGADVRIKMQTYPDVYFIGKVVDIAPAVDTAAEQGQVVKVTSVIPNDHRMLKAGMTGFGKIDGGTKPVIVAFSRAIVRFFLIEVWSWLP